MITTITLKGVRMQVIMKPRSFGWEDGCKEVIEESYEGAEVSENLANSNNLASQEQVDKAAQLALKMTGVTTNLMQNKDGVEYLKMQSAAAADTKKKSSTVDESDDEEESLLSKSRRRRAIMSIGGGGPSSSGGAGGAGGGNPQEARASAPVPSTHSPEDVVAAGVGQQQPRGRQGGGRGGGKGGGRGGRGGGDCSTKPVVKIPPSKRLREISTASPIIQEAKTFITLLGDKQGLANSTCQAAARISAKLSARLTPERQLIYSSGPCQGVEQDPSTILAEMKAYKPKLDLSASLCDLLIVKKNSNPAPAASLYNSYIACISHGLEIHVSCLNEVILRGAREAFDKDIPRFYAPDATDDTNFSELKLALSTSSMIPTPSRAISMDIFTGAAFNQNSYPKLAFLKVPCKTKKE